MGWLEIGARAALVTVFAVAAVSKLTVAARIRFRAAVAELVPRLRGRAAGPVAVLVSGAEWLIVVALVLPVPIAGFALALGALTGFTIAVAAAVRRGSDAGCQCFGRTARPVSAAQIVRNLLLVAIAVLGLAASGARPGEPGGALIAAVAGILLGATLIVADDLADLLHPAPNRPAVSRFHPGQDSPP
ncbi:methylamine utilization protein MauE [Nocardia terpenica]|uniref:MauE/DoxX family redox-associated membrane protein n=1 Tax=Nocardia terpenica TaxID=455432 RepID=UPI002FE2ABD8